ncbi:hypothetical protein FTX61_01740 [Nitriliruptoraceae bacterium ZYF776]|nr:hypothetical protein [Profundirhabdus halotolerans]
MHAFSCGRCGQLVFFHNSACLRCGAPLGFDPDVLDLVVVDDPDRRCANAEVAACNWLVATPGDLCRSCALTRTRPADGDHDALVAFADAEAAKRRLLFQLATLGVEVPPRDEVAGTGVAFDLLASTYAPVTTGHAGGIVTLDLAESDVVHREQVRLDLGEPYRTVLGHFRHEIGHALFPVLVTGPWLARAREVFGDETADYQAALDRHYGQGPPDDWPDRFVSAYATMHPAEDWAETFAHYLHIHGALQTAAAYGVRMEGPEVSGAATDLRSDPQAVDPGSIEDILAAWLPLSYALNAVSRSMGTDDLYPFVLPPAVITKLGVVHDVVRAAGGRG